MRVILAPNEFKGCLPASEVCLALEQGVRRAEPQAQTVKVPVADGGDGFLPVLVEATGGRVVTVPVTGPLGEPVSAPLGLLGDGRRAALETARACGLALLTPEQRNPLLTTTRGVGELICAALDHGCRELLIGIGGSATNDAGTGLAQALGYRFLDAAGRALELMTGGNLERVSRIAADGVDPRLRQVRVRVACDVDNPLYGPRGAAQVYAPQKGATPQMVEQLDAGLRRLAEVIRCDLGLEVADLPGAGAAGGLGAGLVAFCGATLEPGARLVVEAVRLREQAVGADLILTGEGRLDRQTTYGKAPWEVARVGQELGIPVVALAGEVDLEAEDLLAGGLHGAWSLAPGPRSLDEAMDPQVARRDLERVADGILRLLALGRALGR